MSLIKLDLHPETIQLKRFGLLAGLVFGIFGGFTLWRGGLFGANFGEAAATVASVLFAVGGISVLFSLVKPRLNLGLYLVLSIVGAPIGFVMSYVILGILWFLVITPLGLLLRLLGKDLLKQRFDPSASTYFDRREGQPSLDRYFKQF